MKIKNYFCTLMIIIIVAIDQTTKYFAQKYLSLIDHKDFIKGFVEFRYAQNTGMAFSFFSGGRIAFIILTIVVVIACLYYIFFGKGQKNLWQFWSIGVIISGAIGNLIDRIRLKYVIDFINPTFVKFAVFNIADCAVTLGAIVLVGYLLIDMFKTKDGEQNE